MKTLLTTVLLIISVNCFSQQDTIMAINAKDYMDKEVIVVGKVASFRLASNGKYTNYINLEKPYPETIFTVVITNNYLQKLNIKIEDLKDKVICVKGTVTTYKNDPKQIPQIFNPISIEIKNAE